MKGRPMAIEKARALWGSALLISGRVLYVSQANAGDIRIGSVVLKQGEPPVMWSST